MATETGEATDSTEAGESDVETSSEVETETDSESAISPFLRGVTVTTGSTLGGIVAALLSNIYASGAEDTLAGFILIGIILVQFPLYDLIGIDTETFGVKDYLYIFFMTFTLWFISWGILLTASS